MRLHELSEDPNAKTPVKIVGRIGEHFGEVGYAKISRYLNSLQEYREGKREEDRVIAEVLLAKKPMVYIYLRDLELVKGQMELF